MLRSFIAWLDDYLADEGPSGLAKAVVGLLSFAALCSAIVGDVAIRAAGIVVIILTVLAGGLVLLADRRSLQRRIRTDQRLIFRYVDALHGKEAGYRITSWDKTIVIAPNGDAVDSVKVRAKVEKAEVRAFFLWFGCGWDQPAKFQRKVDVRVRNLLVGDLPGTSLDRTVVWYSNSRIAVVVHFPYALKVGSEIAIRLEIAWPGKCLPLMKGECDQFTIRVGTPITHARYKIVLPKGADTYCEPIGVQGDVTLESSRDGEGRLTHVIEANELPPQHTIGLRLELKKGASLAIR